RACYTEFAYSIMKSEEWASIHLSIRFEDAPSTRSRPECARTRASLVPPQALDPVRTPNGLFYKALQESIACTALRVLRTDEPRPRFRTPQSPQVESNHRAQVLQTCPAPGRLGLHGHEYPDQDSNPERLVRSEV